MDAQINPYEPPTTIHDGIVGTARTINVGVTEINTVHVTASIWTGIRTFVQDEDGGYGPEHQGPAEFQVGKRELHLIRIAIDGTGRVDAYVDDLLVEGNLFSSLRVRIFFLVGICVLAVAVLVFFTTTLLLKA